MSKKTCTPPNFNLRGIVASKLIASQGYQRPVNQRVVKLIRDDYVKELVNPIKVSLRNQKYYVFDGQHTLSVLVERFGPNVIVPCIVFQGLTYEDEARLFSKQDEFKRKLTTREHVKALYEADDPDVKEFVAAVESAGYNCSFTGTNCASGSIKNIKYAYEDVFKKKGKERLLDILSIARAAWGDEKKATDDPIIKGLDMFLSLYDGEFKRTDLVNKLASVSPVVIIRNGKADMTHSGAARFAVQIFDVYNKGRKMKLRSKF